MKKKLGIIIAIIIVIVAIVIGVFCTNKKQQTTFGALEEEPIAYLQVCDQNYKIEDYTVSLDKALYDEKSGLGYAVLSVAKENGEVEASINSDFQLEKNQFGEDERFSFDINGSYQGSYELKDGVLYAKFFFSKDATVPLQVYLCDLSQTDETTTDGYVHYEFQVPDTGLVKEFSVSDDVTCYVSPLGMVLVGEGEPTKVTGEIVIKGQDNISFSYEPGQNIPGMEESETTIDGQDSWRVVLPVTEAIDIETVEGLK